VYGHYISGFNIFSNFVGHLCLNILNSLGLVGNVFWDVNLVKGIVLDFNKVIEKLLNRSSREFLKIIFNNTY